MELLESMKELLKVIKILKRLNSRCFSKKKWKCYCILEQRLLLSFLFNYKFVFQKIKGLFELNFKTIMFVLEVTPKKLTIALFFKKSYKIKAVIIFLALLILVLLYIFDNLI